MKNSLGTQLIGPKWRFWRKQILDISQKKFVSAYAQSPRKCSNIEILAKIEGKEAKFFSQIYEGHIRICFRPKKIQIISCLCTFKRLRDFKLILKIQETKCCKCFFFRQKGKEKRRHLSSSCYWADLRISGPHLDEKINSGNPKAT